MSTETQTAAPEEVKMVEVQIDGEWIKVPEGTRVIEACKRAGKFIPHYCYHPKLSSPGNCRMCLIELGMPSRPGPDGEVPKDEDGRAVISWIPRPQISCAQNVVNGMGVRTESPMVQECRHGVMEFLLINHPLDCPICDQAGECRLQEFSVEYGTASSRFDEEKVKKPKRVELGPRITLDDERCILCSRCIRFSKEIAKDDVLGFVDRGSHSTLTCHPGKQLENNYSLNTVDICPVGALTSNDFRFKMRVWFLKETKSICTSCATGCNTVIGTRENAIYRQTPRENDEVNDCWMCDHGRLNFHYLHREDRLTKPLVRSGKAQQEASWPDALDQAGQLLKKYSGDQVAVLASARSTNEEMFLVKRLIEALDTKVVDIITREGEADGILVSADRNPNTKGAQLFKLTGETPGSHTPVLAEKVNGGTAKVLICINEDPVEAGIKPEALKKLAGLICLNILPNTGTESAHVVLPSAGFAEKRGSMINGQGRLQRLSPAIRPPGAAKLDWEILRDLIMAITGQNGIYTVEELFKQMAAEIKPFNGLSLAKIGDQGQPLKLS